MIGDDWAWGLGMGAGRSESFGDLLRRYRVAARLTQEELAERARVSPRAISDLERGERSRPWRDTVQRLAAALQLQSAEGEQLEAAARRASPSSLRVVGRGVRDGAPAPGLNLPVPLTSFVGRERELADIARLLTQTRLLTLTGTGGCGKTRLALRVAAEVVTSLSDGLCFVALAPIRDPDLVPSAICQALAVEDFGNRRPIDVLKDHLRAKHLLLVLDNFEQVLAAAPAVADLLAACSLLRALVTSRAALHVSGEHQWPVPSLALPDRRHLPESGALARYDAVALFIERAVAVRSDFVITDENAAVVAETCRRLEGLPLAIELAAARSKILPPPALLARLSRPAGPLNTLTGGPRDLPARQQALCRTIDWSHDLLDATEQALFRRLAVFVGGCTLEAAAAVCGNGTAGGDSHRADDSPASGRPALDRGSDEVHAAVLDTLASLVDKSLLRSQEQGSGEPRFDMLETIREYGQEKLAESREGDAIRERHARYYLSLIEVSCTPSVWFVPRSDFDPIAEAEWENFRAALRWFADGGDPEMGLRLAVRLSRLWHWRGPAAEGRAWLARFLAHPRVAAPSSLRAAGLLCATFLAEAGDDRPGLCGRKAWP
jgi:predicted ATPase/DNA-binding XRE family transcriptional regulator